MEQISPERLCDAADAAMDALREFDRKDRKYPADLMGAADQPQCLCSFTKFEIEEASMFLVRIGIIPPRH